MHGLRKSYGGTEVVRGIDFEVAAGEVFGFLGPNGAGKTTTIEILEGYRERTDGEVSVLGADPARPTRPWRERVGLVLQECELDPLLTVSETLKLFSAFYSSPRPVSETVDLVGLDEKRDARAGTLSGGPAAAPGCRRGARRAPRARVPRRAHHRLRPLGPA